MSQSDLISDPVSRTLRIFAFDPSLAASLDTAGISEIAITVPWENLGPGPVGEYIEVVDADPASGVFYKPVDLNDPRILATDGLTPSESNPQFHQQMVYAVAMTTIGHFERALGRVALWATHRPPARERRQDGDARRVAGKTSDQPVGGREQFVQRLRIYPHALRDRNAFYSPEKKALLFGYFPVGIKDADNTPGTLVFTCLSHDIIAHETTHALLDGVHPRFDEPINLDVLAFHEAFADIVALFQHFSYPGVLRDQITRTRGDLATENCLGQLAQQFGKATGRGKALRDALGRVNRKTKQWEPLKPDVHALDRKTEAHERGAILVAAVFGAFLKVYHARTRDLYRIASEGTGVLRAGDIHPDLANRLADEAARAAQQTLQMCIRAIDYCAPVGITFGDYLRAIVTADMELNPDDATGFRLAFVESFRQWGIAPRGMRSMSIESLLWPSFDGREQRVRRAADGRQKSNWWQVVQGDVPHRLKWKPWTLEGDRFETWEGVDRNSAVFWGWLMSPEQHNLRAAMGLKLDADKPPPSVFRTRGRGSGARVAVEIHSVRFAVRRTTRGAPATDLVVEITQRRAGYFDEKEQERIDKGKKVLISGRDERFDFPFRSGCTLLINPKGMEVRRLIRTAWTIDDDHALKRLRKFLTTGLEPANAFDFAQDAMKAREPFALLHRDVKD